jgi:hypothetical protein
VLACALIDGARFHDDDDDDIQNIVMWRVCGASMWRECVEGRAYYRAMRACR